MASASTSPPSSRATRAATCCPIRPCSGHRVDPLLAGTKLIAEAWDAAGLYQVGSFVGDSWKEWNGRFRDDARDFFRGAEGSLKRFADRVYRQPEVYGHKEREPEQSVNFVTCHDGFTLNDPCLLQRKHNEANGGGQPRWRQRQPELELRRLTVPTDDPAIERLRNRQVKNFLTATLLSLGVPMLLMGDEVRHSRAATTTPIARTTKSVGSTGPGSRSTRMCSAS